MKRRHVLHHSNDPKSAIFFIAMAVLVVVIGILFLSSLKTPSINTNARLFDGDTVVFGGSSTQGTLSDIQSAVDAGPSYHVSGIAGQAFFAERSYWSAFCSKLNADGFVAVIRDKVFIGGEIDSVAGTDYAFEDGAVKVVCFNVKQVP
jgi:hypothetical protein